MAFGITHSASLTQLNRKIKFCCNRRQNRQQDASRALSRSFLTVVAYCISTCILDVPVYTRTCCCTRYGTSGLTSLRTISLLYAMCIGIPRSKTPPNIPHLQHVGVENGDPSLGYQSVRCGIPYSLNPAVPREDTVPSPGQKPSHATSYPTNRMKSVIRRNDANTTGCANLTPSTRLPGVGDAGATWRGYGHHPQIRVPLYIPYICNPNASWTREVIPETVTPGWVC